MNPDNRDKSDSNTTPVRSPINTNSESGYVAKHPTRYLSNPLDYYNRY